MTTGGTGKEDFDAAYYIINPVEDAEDILVPETETRIPRFPFFMR
jgi:hypothetical protein